MKGRGKPVKKGEESASVSGPGDKDLAEQYRTLEREYEADEERLHRLERDVRVLHDQTAKQVEFSYKMSSVLGDYLKEATKDSGTISAMVNDPGLKQFLEMMYRVFFNLNERGMTKNSEEDGRFIQSLVFIILNISQHPQGQELILSEKFTEVLAILLRLLDSDPDKDVKGHGHECTFGEHLQTSSVALNTRRDLPKTEWNGPVSHRKLAHSILVKVGRYSSPMASLVLTDSSQLSPMASLVLTDSSQLTSDSQHLDKEGQDKTNNNNVTNTDDSDNEGDDTESDAETDTNGD
ncbi:unnamed protein product [Timema podura]|uniref:Uncharacterized protein n=1 Tax=Timema podura TaxID=61482 RepID=A0ABN7P325_TIMPD|nr:unnamed protein product [Timema podura]